MPTTYFFDNLEPAGFQRLINALLTARFGEQIRLLSLRGADDGRDAETAPLVVTFEVTIDRSPFLPVDIHLKPGRYVFQVKHHRMADRQSSIIRGVVVADFERELTSNILRNHKIGPVNYFFLITNVPASKDAVAKVDEKRREHLYGRTEIHADVLWQDHIVSWLDQSPFIWPAFPEIFAGRMVPQLGQIAASTADGLPRSIRMALKAQSARDGIVRFRQINLEHSLAKLFVDLDVYVSVNRRAVFYGVADQNGQYRVESSYAGSVSHSYSCIGTLLSEIPQAPKKMILEGGPGQGKSTATQMLAQIYRSLLLNSGDEYGRLLEKAPKARFPFRLELRLFAEWLGTTDRSVEQYLAESFTKDAGGGQITVEDIQRLAEQQPTVLICDGLDEVGSDELRDTVVTKISECVERWQGSSGSDLCVIVTSRPPAVAGRMGKLTGFERVQILPLGDAKVNEYLARWSDTQCSDVSEKERVSDSFNKRRSEIHVRALIKNPMQLSVLLQFIRLKGEAFPDRRAELYREYFKTVIDRDVEKNASLRQNRDDVEALHEVIGFEIHSRAESDAAAASLSYDQLMELVRHWLLSQGRSADLAQDLFHLGEERLGLIVVLKGEGTQSRYGFEVQPVREYFAAAFINDKWEADAHELFQSMVRRSFWREVALFLAGLRRANEKADLLSRAKALDEDKQEGWRSDGRTIVLQLLQEGVLAAPGHVNQDALSFLVRMLDPSDPSPRIDQRN